MTFIDKPNRKLYAAPRRAFPRCGFHNRTISELAVDRARLRDAKISSLSPGVAFVDNIFGSYTISGKRYGTKLYLSERRIPDFGSRGLTFVALKDLSATEFMFIFTIYIDEKLCARDEDGDGNFLEALCERTFVFGMEILSSYRLLLIAIQSLVAGMTHEEVIENVQPLVTGEKGNHPVDEDVHRLICGRSAICRALTKFIEQERLSDPTFDIPDVDTFIRLNTDSPERLSGYYDVWMRDHRVSPSIVKTKTLEFFVARATPLFDRDDQSASSAET